MFRILTSKITAVILVLLALWLARGAIFIAVQKAGVELVLSGMRTKLETLKKEHETLEKTVSYLRDKSYLEREARLKLNFKAIGEKVAFIYRETTPDTVASGSADVEQGGLEKIKNWLYNLVGKEN